MLANDKPSSLFCATVTGDGERFITSFLQLQKMQKCRIITEKLSKIFVLLFVALFQVKNATVLAQSGYNGSKLAFFHVMPFTPHSDPGPVL